MNDQSDSYSATAISFGRGRAVLVLAALALACGSKSSGDASSAAGVAGMSQGGAGNSGAGASGAPVALGGAADSAGAPPSDTGSVAGSGAGDGAFGGGGAGGGAGAGAAGDGGGPAAGATQNPVLPGFNADPQIALFGNTFYIYPTTDGIANWGSTKFHAFSSSDLTTWKDEGVILSLGSDISWATTQAWAPGIAFKNGTYYFYFAAAYQIGVATSTSPTGPFKDALQKPLIAKSGVTSIDPYVMMDDDGRAYLYYGSGSTGHVVELNADMVSVKGAAQTVSIGGFREGSVAFKRNGKYYFMYSENGTDQETYNVAYGMGNSPMGPFTKAAVNPILKEDPSRGIKATGHNSVLQMPNGDWYIAYHRWAIQNGDGSHREVCLDRMTFNADGTIAVITPSL